MQTLMLSRHHRMQILEAIVVFDTVVMMHSRPRQEAGLHSVFPHNPMLCNIAVGIRKVMIWNELHDIALLSERPALVIVMQLPSGLMAFNVSPLVVAGPVPLKHDTATTTTTFDKKIFIVTSVTMHCN